MKRGLLVTLVLLALAQPAFAWDPYRDELDPGDQTEPDPVPLVVPEGIYLVTDVYAGDTISRDGRTTTYSTATIRETPGTYARVLESVGTGSQSDHDGSSFNHRASLPDGRAVGGTYYEDFVLTPQGFVSVNIVFFQDDRLTTVDDVSGPRPPVTTASAPPPPPPPSAPPISDAPVYRPASQEPSHATTRERAIDDRGDRVAEAPCLPILAPALPLRDTTVAGFAEGGIGTPRHEAFPDGVGQLLEMRARVDRSAARPQRQPLASRVRRRSRGRGANLAYRRGRARRREYRQRHGRAALCRELAHAGAARRGVRRDI